MLNSDLIYMAQALELAQTAFDHNEVPVGAVLVHHDKVIGRGWNGPIEGCDPTAHAEIKALRDAGGSVRNYRFPGSVLYVTVEPCTMCFGALIHARVAKVIYGASEPKAGVVSRSPSLLSESYFNHRIEFLGGVEAEVAGRLMTDFFALRRKNKAKLKKNTEAGGKESSEI